MQDIIKVKNLNAIVDVGRTHLLLQNFQEAHSSFSTAYKIVDNKIDKKDINTILDRIKLIIEEQNKNSEKELTASKTKIRDADLKQKELVAESICSRKKIKTMEICKIMPAAGILTEFVQKSKNPLPIYNQTNTTKEGKTTVHITCECLGRIESGSGPTKQKAKEKAAKKMIKYLQKVGRLRLTKH
jgi:hypothetical protein